MRMPLLFTLAIGLLSVACGGSGGGHDDGQNSIPAPTGLHIIQEYGPETFALAWTPPQGTVDGYNLEMRSGAGSFTKINSVLIPSTYTYLGLAFSPNAPEDTDFTFRMNSAKGTGTSAYSNTAVVHHGVYAPGQPTGAYDWDRLGVVLNWSRNSTASDGLIVERMVSDSWGSGQGSWVSLPVSDPLASTYVDSTATLGTYYFYRITNKKGDTPGPAGPVSPRIFVGLAAPDQPVATFDFNTKGMTVSWNKNTTFNDGVRIERIQTDAYGSTIGSWSELTPTDPTASTFLDMAVTLNAYYSYRVSNLKGGVASSASPSSSQVLAGLAGPSYLSAYWDGSLGGVALTWYASSLSDDSFLLERALCDASGTPIGSWVTAGTVAGSARSYTDSTVQEISTYIYRITETRLTTASLPILSYSVFTYMFPPTNLVATPVQGGIKLEWKNRSLVATQVTVNRGGRNNLSSIAVLSAGSTSYLDPDPPLGYYNYQVVAQNGYNAAYSETVMAATPNPPGTLALAATTLAYPQANDAYLGPAGTWAFLSQQPFGVLSNNDPWQPFFPNNSTGSASSTIQVDAQGWPHVVYLAADPQNAQNRLLTHTWTDGNSWKSEVIGQTNFRATSANCGYAYRLDSTGTPQALLDHSDDLHPYGGSTSTLTYVHKVNGVWASDSLASLDSVVSNVDLFRLVLDGADHPHLLFGNWLTISECSPDGKGGWVATSLPTGTANAGWYDPLEGVWTDADTASVFYEGPGNQGPALMVLQKVAGVWQSPLQLGSGDYYGADAKLQAAASPDHSRVAISYSTSLGVKIYHWNGTSWVETLAAPPLTSNPWVRLGIDGKDKVHLITYIDAYPFAGYTEYKEQ